MAKKQINYLQILGYVAMLAPLIEQIDADFSDDETPEDRIASTANAIIATMQTASTLIARKNPKYSDDLNELNVVIQSAVAKFLEQATLAAPQLIVDDH